MESYLAHSPGVLEDRTLLSMLHTLVEPPHPQRRGRGGRSFCLTKEVRCGTNPKSDIFLNYSDLESGFLFRVTLSVLPSEGNQSFLNFRRQTKRGIGSQTDRNSVQQKIARHRHVNLIAEL
jgi:hypothetical protein